ncbi:unnamed protein product [Timema podura]|uniref:Uncharacterized protein n=1 Tax=Timema podura TaxID=61482 RepID=A0ABN7NIY7_TIMPD|nr:unnamed protein product [Timema podura]
MIPASPFPLTHSHSTPSLPSPATSPPCSRNPPNNSTWHADSTVTRRHRHSISGQMSYLKMLGFGVAPGGGLVVQQHRKMNSAGSTNSLFSTAVISGSSSAPNLRDIIPNTASVSDNIPKQRISTFYLLCLKYGFGLDKKKSLKSDLNIKELFLTVIKVNKTIFIYLYVKSHDLWLSLLINNINTHKIKINYRRLWRSSTHQAIGNTSQCPFFATTRCLLRYHDLSPVVPYSRFFPSQVSLYSPLFLHTPSS